MHGEPIHSARTYFELGDRHRLCDYISFCNAHSIETRGVEVRKLLFVLDCELFSFVICLRDRYG